ncbi:DNA polymerase III subunit alpha, partial [Microvirga sp. 3-52]|nr:DNA polymerase III subunit alpha [Microvirga sp. 3-52]
VFIGISRPGGKIHGDENTIENIAESTAISITAVYESRFIRPEDSFAYEVATAIRTGEKISEMTDQNKNEFQYFYMPTEENLNQWFSGKEHWLQNASSLLQSCNVEITKEKSLMPVFPLPENQDSKTYLREKCIKGLTERLGKTEDVYLRRLDYELSVIKEMGFTDYFLIVEDFIRFSAENNILTGPGRGSSAGSLVAFALRITDVDPIQYGLIFERFLNPERKSMPDIDIDFADNRRAEVLHYVAEKYGKNHVAQIITFGTLTARSVARNVARVFGFSTEEMAYLSSVIPSGSKMTLEKAFEESSKLRDWIAVDLFRRQWFDAASSIEGLPRNASTHAAGVVLSPKPLVDTVPLQDGGDGIYLTQWPMGDVEEQGLLKMDFLGLRNLTLLDRIRRLIHKDKGVFINFEQIPLNDAKTFDVFRRGDTTGVFQFESDGMRDTLRLIQPNRFEDIFAINALYRPG